MCYILSDTDDGLFNDASSIKSQELDGHIRDSNYGKSPLMQPIPEGEFPSEQRNRTNDYVND